MAITVEKSGDEFLVNTATADRQSTPAIQALANGGFVVSWTDNSQGVGGAGGDTSGTAIKAQIYDAAGAKVGDEFLVNTTTASDQYFPTIGALADGGFIIGWTSLNPAGFNTLVGQRFDTDGTRIGDEIQLSRSAVSGADTAAITGLADGGFVISWTGADNNGLGVRAQRFDANGASIGAEQTVNSSMIFDQSSSSIASLAGGGYAITWTDQIRKGDINGNDTIKAQAFGANGARIGGEITVSTSISGHPIEPTITGLSNGGFLVSWTLEGRGAGVFAQLFDANGASVGSEFRVDTEPSFYKRAPSATALADGGFLITWTDPSGTLGDTSLTAIKARLYDAAGAPVGDEFLVNSQTLNGQTESAVTGLVNGGFAVSWTDTSRLLGDGSSSAIAAQLFDISGDDIIGSTGSDRLIGTGFSETLRGDNGDDTLLGLNGNDILIGGGGRDVLDGGGGVDTASYAGSRRGVEVDLTLAGPQNTRGAGLDTLISIENLTGSDFADRLTGDDRSNVLSGGGGDDRLSGGGGNDRLDGGDGNDRLDGGTGVDLLIGGFGNDTYVVDNTADTVIENSPFGGKDLVMASISYRLGDNIENLTLTGDGDIDGTGNALDNILIGNAGDNVLNGGAGRDVLTGGLGRDTFVFDNFVPQNRGDVIKDFVSGTDQIALSAAVFTALAGNGPGALRPDMLAIGTAALTPDQHLVYNPQTGALLYDIDGSGGAAAVLIATLSGHPVLSAADIIIG